MADKKIRVKLIYPEKDMEITLHVNRNFSRRIISQYVTYKNGANSYVFSSLKEFYQCIDRAHEYE